ncbi:SH3 domain-binding glutamic acid-rich-like protein [Desmophyllum pertusum]|uniref:SH3 domain-binding glutamic acid-rich-like protein n=1 Tax=Desmophyllum pertusum TaxID=174260 RepID=A0A9X0DD37_9CNID|nr:SH3 domain-binding glutamic acid-rich-like protein [Desmophyllum pertusum]
MSDQYVTLFISDLSGNKEIKKRQQRIRTLLKAYKVSFQEVDVAQDEDELERMRELVGDEAAVAPQIANGEEYCGDYVAFETAIEKENLEEFLKLKK